MHGLLAHPGFPRFPNPWRGAWEMSVQLACSYESHTLELNCAGAENTCEYIYFSKLWCNRGLSYSAITTTHIQIVSYPKSKFPVQEIRATLHSHTSTCQNHRTEIFFHFTTIFCSFPIQMACFPFTEQSCTINARFTSCRNSTAKKLSANGTNRNRCH
jgi:hypothetical protein